MQAWEVLFSIRMLLDDTRDWYFPNILWAIDRAQERVVHRLYAEQNELALRPLYTMDERILPMVAIGEIDLNTGIRKPIGRVMYPRYCEFYLVDPSDNRTEIPNSQIVAKYVTPDQYYRFRKNFLFQPYDVRWEPRRIRGTPKIAYYTLIKNDTNNPEMTFMLYPYENMAENYRARLYYIRYPKPFAEGFDSNGNLINPNGLEIDSIYHPDVIGLAAEILNHQDVGEYQRGEIFNVYQGDTKLTLKDVLNSNLEDLKRR